MMLPVMKHVFAPAVVAFLLSQSAFALSPEGQLELRKEGTITVMKDGKKVGHFEVKFMPGSNNIKADAKKRWSRALDLMDDFVDKHEFWRGKVIGSFNHGVDIIKRGVTRGIYRIPEDFRDTRRDNAEVEGSFGSAAAKVKNWIEFGAIAGFRVLRTIGGIGAGTIYAVVAPTGHVLYRPIAAGTNALVAGTLWPVVKYSWNGAAWVLVKNSNEPKEGDMTVTFIPETLEHNEIASVQ